MTASAGAAASTDTGPPPSARRRRAATAGALIAAFGGFAGFNLTLSALPAYAVRSGAGPSGAGTLTAALMAATLVVQPCTPWLFARLGRRHSLALSGALLGLPCLALPAVSTLPALTGLAAVRGLGFGMFVVAGVTFTAELFPPDRRGRAIGWYGAVVGVAGVLGAPLGIALARRGAYSPVFTLAAGTAALVLAGSLGFPRTGPPVRPSRARSDRRATRGTWRSVRPMAGPLLVETASTAAYGVVFTFLPLTAAAAPGALLAAQASTVLSRLGAGRLIDRFGGRPVLVPAGLATTLGTAAGAASHTPALLMAGAVLFGAGFGAVQSATLILALRAAGDRPGGLALAGVAWNIAFDGGTGVGSLAGGPVLLLGGPAALFPATATLLAVILLLDLRFAASPHRGNAGGPPE
ncbi:MFS transporter [Streptomyces sp. NPDC101237]|uniref:MFS transporter n=1 Tax=Streptomyces sp. NPDC101237 TaxID=3366139 RepID=UPI0038187EA0